MLKTIMPSRTTTTTTTTNIYIYIYIYIAMGPFLIAGSSLYGIIYTKLDNIDIASVHTFALTPVKLT